jgi:hypothetical protein
MCVSGQDEMAMIGARARVVSLLVSQIVARESQAMPMFYPIRRWLHGHDVPASVGQTVVWQSPRAGRLYDDRRLGLLVTR